MRPVSDHMAAQLCLALKTPAPVLVAVFEQLVVLEVTVC